MHCPRGAKERKRFPRKSTQQTLRQLLYTVLPTVCSRNMITVGMEIQNAAEVPI